MAHGHARIEDPKNRCIFNLYSAITIKGFNTETDKLHDTVDFGMGAVILKNDGEKAKLTGVILESRILVPGILNLLVKTGLPVVVISADPQSVHDSPDAIKAPWLTFSQKM
jgi:hypothetical protein